MKYYSLTEACGTSETGSLYPQTDGMFGEYDFNSKDSIYQLNRTTIPESVTDFGVIKIGHSAKLTDVISTALISSAGLIVSEKLKIILEGSKLQKSVFIKLKLNHRSIILENYYRLFVENEDRLKRVDFERSSFKIKRASKDLGEALIASEGEFYEKLASVQKESIANLIVPSRLITKAFDCDLFTNPFGTSLIISEKLKNKLEDEKITGIKIEELKNIEISE